MDRPVSVPMPLRFRHTDNVARAFHVQKISLYRDRIARSHRDHCRFDRFIASRDHGGSRGGTPHGQHEQNAQINLGLQNYAGSNNGRIPAIEQRFPDLYRIDYFFLILLPYIDFTPFDPLSEEYQLDNIFGRTSLARPIRASNQVSRGNPPLVTQVIPLTPMSL